MPSKLKAFIPTQRGLCEKVTWISAFDRANVTKSYRGRFKWQVRNIFTWRHIAPSYGQWMAEMKSTCFPPLKWVRPLTNILFALLYVEMGCCGIGFSHSLVWLFIWWVFWTELLLWTQLLSLIMRDLYAFFSYPCSFISGKWIPGSSEDCLLLTCSVCHSQKSFVKPRELVVGLEEKKQGRRSLLL